MCADFVQLNSEFFRAKNGQTVAKCLRDFLARHVVDLPVMPYGGDVGIVVCSGVGPYSLYEAGPLCDRTHCLVVGCPLRDGVKLLAILLSLEGDGKVVGGK